MSKLSRILWIIWFIALLIDVVWLIAGADILEPAVQAVTILATLIELSRPRLEELSKPRTE